MDLRTKLKKLLDSNLLKDLDSNFFRRLYPEEIELLAKIHNVPFTNQNEVCDKLAIVLNKQKIKHVIQLPPELRDQILMFTDLETAIATGNNYIARKLFNPESHNVAWAIRSNKLSVLKCG
jgi:hypothetical protein